MSTSILRHLVGSTVIHSVNSAIEHFGSQLGKSLKLPNYVLLRKTFDGSLTIFNGKSCVGFTNEATRNIAGICRWQRTVGRLRETYKKRRELKKKKETRSEEDLQSYVFKGMQKQQMKGMSEDDVSCYENNTHTLRARVL